MFFSELFLNECSKTLQILPIQLGKQQEVAQWPLLLVWRTWTLPKYPFMKLEAKPNVYIKTLARWQSFKMCCPSVLM